MASRLKGYLDLLQNLSPRTLDQLADYTSKEFEFKDPFNHTHTRDEFIAILDDMYQKLGEVSFTIHTVMENDSGAMIQWTFEAYNKITGPIYFQGMSHISLNDMGIVKSHIDYWDGSELMQKIPMLGLGVKLLRGRFAH
jgi:hypothetical protein